MLYAKMAAYERQLILAEIVSCNFNMSKACKNLGIGRAHIQQKCVTHDLNKKIDELILSRINKVDRSKFSTTEELSKKIKVDKLRLTAFLKRLHNNDVDATLSPTNDIYSTMEDIRQVLLNEYAYDLDSLKAKKCNGDKLGLKLKEFILYYLDRDMCFNQKDIITWFEKRHRSNISNACIRLANEMSVAPWLKEEYLEFAEKVKSQ